MDTGGGGGGWTGSEEERQRRKTISLHLNVDESTGANGCGGSDSGLDVTPAASCDSSLASGCYDPCKSPLGPFSPTETSGGGPSSLPCYTMTAVNGYSGSNSRPSTPPTWRRADRPPKLPFSVSSMSSSFHFETSRNSPPRTEPKKTDLNTAAKQSKISTVKKLVSTYDMVKSLDRYATLPRRRRKSKENLAVVVTTAAAAAVTSPGHKEPSLNRAASLRRKHIEQGALAQNATMHSSVSSASPCSSQLPPVKYTPPGGGNSRSTRPPSLPVTAVKTKIYHEVCSQTCLTAEDMTEVLSGCCVLLSPVENRIETKNAQVQVSIFIWNSCRNTITVTRDFFV